MRTGLDRKPYFFLILLLIVVSCFALKNKKVNVTLKTSWPAYPLISEASEFFADLSNELFWKYFDELQINEETDKVVYEYLVSKASLLLSDAKLSLFNWALSIHNGNAKLELYRQVAIQELSQLSDRQKVEDNCKAWVFVKGHAICSTEKFQQQVSDAIKNGEDPEIYSFDHVHPSSSKDSSPVLVLYGMVGDKTTLEFHNLITDLLTTEKYRYVFRHYFPKEIENGPKLNLQGYGIDLALKSVEYKVIDDTEHTSSEDSVSEEEEGDDVPIQGFDFRILAANHPDSTSELLALKAHLLSEDLQINSVKVWELRDLGLVSAQMILEAKEPLRMLRDISQNLPALTHSLARQTLKQDTKDAIIHTVDQLNSLGMSRNLLWINNIPYDPKTINLFQLYAALSKQIINYDELKLLHLSSQDIYKILALPVPESTSSIKINIYSELTDYANDLETDIRYSNWYQRTYDILQPVWPGQLHFVAKNFFTVVIVVDPANRNSLTMAQKLSSLVWQNLPARVGFLFDVSDEMSELALRAWKYVRLNFGISKWYQFLQQLAASQNLRVTEEDIRAAIENSAGNYFDDVKSFTEHDIDNYISNCKQFLSEKGLAGLSPLFFINGHLLDIPSTDALVDTLLSKIFELRSEMQQFVQVGQIIEGTNIYHFVTSQPEVLPSFNRLIIPSSSQKPNYVNIYDTDFLDSLVYINSIDGQDLVLPITHLLAINLDTEQGKLLASNAINRMFNNAKNVRLGFIDRGNSIVLRAIDAVLRVVNSAEQYLPIIQQLIDSVITGDDSLHKIVAEIGSNKYQKFKEIFDNTEEWNSFLEKQHYFCTSTLHLESTQNAIITSGRLIVFPESVVFTPSDLQVLESYEYGSRLYPLYEILEDVTYDMDPDLITSTFISNTIQKLASLLVQIPDRPTYQLSPPLIEPSFTVTKGSTSDISIVAIIDPLSNAAQRITPILISLSELFNSTTQVILCPQKTLSDVPLKNFYRYAIDTISFDENEKMNPGGIVTFSNLPQGSLLSTTVKAPPSWLVLSSKCVHDLDNILLDKLPPEESAVNAEFTLENILVEGSCMDMSNRGVPPRGLELILEDKIKSHRQDSLVMSNLGYFQLKANPAIWNLTLAPGRASLIYQTKDQIQHSIIVKDFIGEKDFLYVEKRPGMESVPLFEDSESASDPFWGQFTGGFFGTATTELELKDETIHVFSLASGHLYERFLKIMMLSVIKHTTAPVKFWILSNFLSPAFKQLVPKMAEQFGFQVELVTYKWPDWLHEQTEKQRIIWGYKILFLDVLFPLDIKRIVYVDADQIVYSDLKELRDLKLPKGVPYAYTPFCSGSRTNPSTTGFRFWDSGYWRDHLGSRPYHISALYVVDLGTLRTKGYADQLRTTYHGLSKDPNSLANLDQDLPNYLQHIIPIHSLPEEWLWCETWCTMESKPTAKTIDLCNNPLTKVPKLEAAQRLIPEWNDYDNEIKQFEATLSNR